MGMLGNFFKKVKLTLSSPKFPTNRVKLVAIAKDEGAYLSEWLFHHLEFGFDSIEVYLNNISDNSEQLGAKFESVDNVNFIDGNVFFQQSGKNPQNSVYRHALKKAKHEEFSHVMFLDIDEFWVSRDFSSSIHDFLNLYDTETEVYCFEWLVRTAENTAFSPAFDVEIYGSRNRQIKSLIKTNVNYSLINPHSIVSDSASYKLADGSEFLPTVKSYTQVPARELEKGLKPFFVLHRLNRSELEYVSALGRGNPICKIKNPSKFKENRFGFDVARIVDKVEFSSELLGNYYIKFDKFREKYALSEEIKQGQKFVYSRFDAVLKSIEIASIDEESILKNCLNNVKDEKVHASYDKYKIRHSID